MNAKASIESRLEAGGRVWLVSDIHANAVALQALFARIPPDDAVVLLGDLLTYGCAPQRTLELVEQCLRTRPSVLLAGNHDLLYRDLLAGQGTYYAQLPDWLRESVDWTFRQIDARWFCEQLPWQSELLLGEILVAHANPFGPLDWTYLDTIEHYRRALDVTTERGFRLGVFGHVHRPRLLVRAGGAECWSTQAVAATRIDADASAVWNVGSVGQQRCLQTSETAGYLRRVGAAIELGHSVIDYDLEAHLTEIRAAGLSAATVERLICYHRRAAS
jgi:diadenosine tetraphosphatase ApaH/serine/threonine PP2A family protein phosphatase